jgi:hypothetical protein
MSYKSLFSIETVEGAIKIVPSEDLKSKSIPQQLAAVETELRKYKAELQKINDPENEETPESDKCEVELVILILKNFLKQFREAHWERIEQ